MQIALKQKLCKCRSADPHVWPLKDSFLKSAKCVILEILAGMEMHSVSFCTGEGDTARAWQSVWIG